MRKRGMAFSCRAEPASFRHHSTITSKVTLENSSVHDFEFAGIGGNEPGTALTVTYDHVRGNLPPATVETCPATPQTGSPTNVPGPCGSPQIAIQIGFNATGKITNNTVLDEIWAQATGSNNAASGILVYDAEGITISGNHVGNTQYGISAVGDGACAAHGLVTCSADDASIIGNAVDGTLLLDGIDVCGSTGGKVIGNTVVGSGQSAIHLDGTCAPAASGGITVAGNTINEACAGILVGDVTEPDIIQSNTFYDVVSTTYNSVEDTATCVSPSGGPIAEVSRAQTAGSRQKEAACRTSPSGDSCDLTHLLLDSESRDGVAG